MNRFNGEFDECACGDGKFNRHNNNRRQDAERRIITQTKKSFPLANNQTIKLNYLSLGAGGLLQDYILCILLLLAGYTLRVFLIEKTFIKQPVFKKFADQLSLFSKEMGRGFSVEMFQDVNDFIRNHPHESTHVAHAIDFDVALSKRGFNDLLLMHQLLDNNGFLYLSYNDYDYMLSKVNCLLHAYSGFSLFQWKPFFDEKEYKIAMHIPQINRQLEPFENQVKENTNLPRGIVKTILSYGFFPEPEKVKDQVKELNDNIAYKR